MDVAPASPEAMAPSTELSRAIATLEQDLPQLFERDLAYDIYAADIHFSDPLSHFQGLRSYRLIFWSLRFHARLFFTQIQFDVQRVQPRGAGQVVADWTVVGQLRLPWRPQLCFNGQSTYTLNGEGLICRHVDTWDQAPRAILQQFFRAS